MVGLKTAQKSDHHPAESAVLLSRCRDFHPYGPCNGRHCCGADDDLGRGARRGHYYALDHVAVRDYGCVRLVHVRHCILRPCYALGGDRRSGHALYWYLMVVGAPKRHVGTEDDQRNVNL